MPTKDRQGNQSELHDSSRRLQAVFDNASVAIFLMDDRQQCVFMNKAAEKLTGYGLAEILELDRPLHDIVHHKYPDGRPFPLHECAIDRAFPEHNQTQGEEVFVHKDGSFYPVGFTASPIRDESSRTIGTIIEVRDISEEKAAQERQRLLVNELNHRVKNTLSAVQAIAAQSLKGVDREARQQFEGRLSALSSAHNILTNQGWSEASLVDVVNAAVRPFGFEDRIHLAGSDHPVGPKMVIALAMALHELATNACKYGALSVEGGRVRVSWEVHSANDQERLLLTWGEVGGPPTSAPFRTGFGTRLLKRQFALEFDGSVEMDYQPEGLTCRIDACLPPLTRDNSRYLELSSELIDGDKY